MRDGGKGNLKRPLVVSEEQFNNNWDAIFNNNGVSLNSALHPELEGPPTENVFNSELNPNSLETIKINIGDDE